MTSILHKKITHIQHKMSHNIITINHTKFCPNCTKAFITKKLSKNID